MVKLFPEFCPEQIKIAESGIFYSAKPGRSEQEHYQLYIVD
jgi:hypothetical protein